MLSNKDTAYLVDGSSYIYRAYHAIRGLSNSKGFPTNAVLGFTKMILKLLAAKTPEYLAVVFDAKGPTFRHAIYEAYKANRPPMPEDMAEQIPAIKDVVTGLNIMMIEEAGYEADDIIGTLAGLLENKGFQVVMVTGDKDFRQLITSGVSMWDTMKDTVYDYSSLKETSGIEPQQFVDVMALSGDASDNIPGVPGVGEKTALDLIREFGSLENVLRRANEINRKKIRNNIIEYKNEALLSKQLVQINKNVPLDFEIYKLKLGVPNRIALANVFRELEFRDLWEQFGSGSAPKGAYQLCTTKEERIALADGIRTAGHVAIKLETSDQNPFLGELTGIALALEEQQASYLPVGHRNLGALKQVRLDELRRFLRDIFENQDILKVGHDMKNVAKVLRRYGIELQGPLFDTMVASYVINPGLRQHDSDFLAQHYLGHKMIRTQDVVGKGKEARRFWDVPVEEATAYVCEAADMTLRLAGILEKKISEYELDGLYHDMEMKLLPVLLDMELTGIRIDAPFFAGMSRRFAEQMEDVEKQIFQEAGMEFNINSPQQLGHVLFEKLQLPVQKKTAKSKRFSTDVEVLKKLSAFPHKVPELVLRYRMLSKLKSTYLDALVNMVEPSTGRVHTSFNQTVAATGRLSSSNPNLQNIPIRTEEGREIRKGFVAEEGHCFVVADYSQVELRVFAHYSEEVGFIEAFKHDEDIHARTASEIMGVDIKAVTQEMRRTAKAINFGIIYGMGARRLSQELTMDYRTAKDQIQAFYERYPGVLRYREQTLRFARREGYVSTLFKRRRYLPDIEHSKGPVRAEAERMAINTPIQGTAADLIKTAMINVHKRLALQGYLAKMLLQVHDELLFEVPDGEVDAVVPIIREEMEGVYPLKVPLKVDIGKGKNWEEAH